MENLDSIPPRTKVAIPRGPTPRASQWQRRLGRACESCRRRKIKCSGDRPTCGQCAYCGKDCVYKDIKRIRIEKHLALLSKYAECYEALLRGIEGKVDASIARRIKKLFKSTKKKFAEDSSDSDSALSVGSLAAVDIVEGLKQKKVTRDTGHFDESPEITSMQYLEDHIATSNREPTNGLDKNTHWSVQFGQFGFHARKSYQNSRRGASIAMMDYHIDNLDILLVENTDPFEIPPRNIANEYFNAYMEFVHPTYQAIRYSAFTAQYENFYFGTPRQPHRKWLPILNLIFAIGCHYCRLANPTIHKVHNNDRLEFSVAIYLLCLGQVERASKFSCMALHSAILLGINHRLTDTRVQDASKEARCRLWWAIHSLEHQLTSMLGRTSCKGEILTDEEATKVVQDEIGVQPTPTPREDGPQLDPTDPTEQIYAQESLGDVDAETSSSTASFQQKASQLEPNTGEETTRETRYPTPNAPDWVPGAFPEEPPEAPEALDPDQTGQIEPELPTQMPNSPESVPNQGVEEVLAQDQEVDLPLYTDQGGSLIPGQADPDVVLNDVQDDDAEMQAAIDSQIEWEIAPYREVGLDLDESNIIPGKRTRRSTKRDDAYFTQAMLQPDEPDIDLPVYDQAFYTRMVQNSQNAKNRHKDDLPAPPKSFREVKGHEFEDGFNIAMQKEIDGLTEKCTFSVVSRPNDRAKQVLPLKWVYTYKFDENGVLQKCKARICVRGDLERVSQEEKRSATLALKTARMIFAIVAVFDLDLRQRDAVAAFLNSSLDDKEIYTQTPDGFRSTQGMVWHLNKALYGLRISPKLWQKEASRVLSELGLKQLCEDPCVFIGKGVIIFFYVDDFLIASHKTASQYAQELERKLENTWELTDHGDAEWFLNIRIIRNRQLHCLWLCQDSYIESIAARFRLSGRPPVVTPMPIDELSPYEGTASPESIRFYQEKVGSIQYAATITRPDIAKPATKLAQFLLNPGPNHHAAADQAPACYTDSGLKSGSMALNMASDASFGDHPDRKSSAGMICMLYGGPVDWKASKQKTVTTSTTEAELLGLSDAAKTLIWWKRILVHIGLEMEYEKITLDCDNQRTVDLLTKEGSFETKLRHVDIHRSWLRQEVQEGRIRIRWVPTTQMVADGFTKILPRQRFEAWLKLLHMEDVGDMIEL
ncbi:hypothetical protein N7495_001431 [Penicillium taxi]|uniref:uncharacterized protein n=1 Tax=Penicillium taxi TaxID=168475 RepID=UPI002544F1E8|nr:uncharacterized protein N7495_001431 [Penicillium taxi]KAJ5908749.1 hypothetical protein N7495_001431 [Penicillium taxi]